MHRNDVRTYMYMCWYECVYGVCLRMRVCVHVNLQNFHEYSYIEEVVLDVDFVTGCNCLCFLPSSACVDVDRGHPCFLTQLCSVSLLSNPPLVLVVSMKLLVVRTFSKLDFVCQESEYFCISLYLYHCPEFSSVCREPIPAA